MHPHLELVPRILMDKRRTVDGIAPVFRRQGHRPVHFGVLPKRRIDDLTCSRIDDLMIVPPNLDPQPRHEINLLGLLLRLRRLLHLLVNSGFRRARLLLGCRLLLSHFSTP